MVLCMATIEACIESFLEEAEEDMELDDLLLLENIMPLQVPAPNPTSIIGHYFCSYFLVHF